MTRSKRAEWRNSAKRPEQWGEEEFQLSETEWAQIEKAEHDEAYEGAKPFGLDELRFDVDHVLWYEDYAYKKGRRRDRGHRTRRLFQAIGLDELSGKRVLDIGSGIGQYSVFFAMHGATVTGVELSSVGVSIANQMATANSVADRCTFVEGSFTDQSFDDDAFDVVVLHEVYHHLIKYAGSDREILRVTRPGGLVVMADTLQGGGLVHIGRRMTKAMRHLLVPGSREHEIRAGDVLITREDYERIGAEGKDYTIWQESYFYMIKQTFLRYHTDLFVVRALLRGAKLADDLLFTLFPKMRTRGAEAVLRIEV